MPVSAKTPALSPPEAPRERRAASTLLIRLDKNRVAFVRDRPRPRNRSTLFLPFVSFLHPHLSSPRTPLHTITSKMARQFFVGGNFKMNPISREQKKALVKTLNGADVDQNVGPYWLPSCPPSDRARLISPRHA